MGLRFFAVVLAHADNQAMHIVVDLRQGGPRSSAHRGGGMDRSGKVGARILPVPPRFRFFCFLRLPFSGRWSQSALEPSSNLFVVSFLRENFVAFEDAAGVGVDDEDGMVPGVEENRVC